MGAISTVEVQTRLDIYEILSRYCHFVDHDEGDHWAELFTPQGVFEIKGIMLLEGREQLRDMAGFVRKQGNGLWRHQITNILIDHAANRKEMAVRAYGLVTDWGNGGAPISFTDYCITLRHTCRWQIAHVLATPVVREPAMAV